MRINVYSILLSCFLVFTSLLPISAQQCGVIYVSPAGAASGAAGTKANPANLAYGLALAGAPAASTTIIWMAEGTYNISAPIQLFNNLSLEGGFDPVTWIKSNATPTLIIKDNSNLISAANALVIVEGVNISGFSLQDLTLQEANTTGVSTTAYGIYLNGCSNYNIVRCNVTAGNGSPGADGTAGASGADGGNGGNGNAYGDENNVPLGGAAGIGGGGSGGIGSDGGKWSGVYALAGAGSCGAAAGNTPGNGPGCGCGIFSNSHNGSCSGSSPTNGAAGAAGDTGVAGTVGPAGTVVSGYYQPGAQANSGGNGLSGCGGGGGGGGSGRQQPGPDDVGGSGGGGGAGGAGGTGGTGGTGGGGSFAIFLTNNGVSGNIIDCDLIPGSGGTGGAGGIGGNGGNGGNGGTGGAGFCGAGFSQGANGGNGGSGGKGGNGGTGAAGSSVPLSENGGVPVTQSNITSVPGNPPVITVQNYGCTNAQVLFTAPISGAWNFGANAIPATGTGQGPIAVNYTAVGKKTIIFSGTTFTNFVNIFNSQTISNTISQSAIHPINGCPDTFTTTIQGTDYVWDFGANAYPPVDSGISDSVASTVFTIPGTYTVSVYVNTPCCGIVKDSITFTVNTSSLTIALSASPDTVCQGSPITFTAQSPTTYTNYTYFVNGLPVSVANPSNTYTISSLNPGDSVTVLGFLGLCYSNPSTTIHPVINIIPAAPALSNSTINDTACAGDTIIFTATPGYDSYAFSNGSSTQQTGPSNIWITNALSVGNSPSVTGIKNGCTSPVSNIDPVAILPVPFIQDSLENTNICQGNSDFVRAYPSGYTSYQFWVNGVSVQDSNISTYTTSGFNSGDSIVVIAYLNGCPSPSVPTLGVTVRPTPVVTMSSSAANDSICQGLPITFTASATPSGDTAYLFYNGSTLVQDGPVPTYTTNTLANNSSVSVIAIDNGCPSIPSDTITTTVNPAPPVNPGSNPSPVCINAAPVTLTGFSPAGGVWTGQGITSPTGVVSPLAAGAGSHYLTYTYIDPNSGCPGFDSILLLVNPLPVVSVVPASPSICSGYSQQLVATGGTTYVWAPVTGLSNANIANPVASPTQTTTYQLSVTDVNNCSNDTAVVVTVNPDPVATFSYLPVCANTPTVFNNNTTPFNSSTYVWNFGDGNTSTLPEPSHTYTTADSFSVSLIAELGSCNDTFTLPVIVYPAVNAAFSANPLVSFNDSIDPVVFTNESTNATVWIWNFGDNLTSGLQSPSHIYKTPGTYTVSLIASNQFGCTDSSTKDNYITIYPQPTVFIPNAFTPGTGNANDILRAYSSGAIYFEWTIFDRLGEKVYQSNDVDGGWDGTYRGKPAAMGVYSYYLRIVFNDNTSRQYKGTVTLLR